MEWHPACHHHCMITEFLAALKLKAEALNSNIRTALTPREDARPNVGALNQAGADSAALLAMIDAEIARPMNANELEAQLADTSARPGETPEQTAYRLKAQKFDNRLVARP